jgi:hypothetical protein
MGSQFKRNPNSKTSRMLASRTEDKLTPKMKLRRDMFITEFVSDFNAINAVLRSGGATSTAAKTAYQFMREPYVQRRIKEVIDSMEEADIINRKRILAGLIREANYMGIGASHGARVSAYSKLASILGMDAPQKHQVQVSGGVMVVPMTTNLNDWETVAEQKQLALKEDVRS